MIHEHFAAYSFVSAPDSIQEEAIDYLLSTRVQPPSQIAALEAVQDTLARVRLLALAQITANNKSYAQSGKRAGKGGLRQASKPLSKYFKRQVAYFLNKLGLVPTLPSMAILLPLSFVSQFTFTLAQPYLSRDEQDFYIIDNPVRKDKVFGLPYVAPSSWKGSLRAAMVRQLVAWWQGESQKKAKRSIQKQFVARRIQLFRLFGPEKSVLIEEAEHRDRRARQGDEETGRGYLDDVAGDEHLASWYRRFIRRYVAPDGFHAGRLFFYPTFFTQMGLEVINPHSRQTGAGTLPILLESVPQGAQGTFTLLYVPFDRVGEDGQQTRVQVAADLRLVAEGLQAMFCAYGFGAKTSSGFGVAREECSGSLTLRAQGESTPPPNIVSSSPPAAANLTRHLEATGLLRPEYRNADGTFRERTEADLQRMSKKERQLYDKAKRWWEHEGKQHAEEAARQPEPPAQPVATPKEVWPTWQFKSFAELVERADEAAKRCLQGVQNER